MSVGWRGLEVPRCWVNVGRWIDTWAISSITSVFVIIVNRSLLKHRIPGVRGGGCSHPTPNTQHLHAEWALLTIPTKCLILVVEVEGGAELSAYTTPTSPPSNPGKRCASPTPVRGSAVRGRRNRDRGTDAPEAPPNFGGAIRYPCTTLPPTNTHVRPPPTYTPGVVTPTFQHCPLCPLDRYPAIPHTRGSSTQPAAPLPGGRPKA